uniref:Uncharacterized protein n=1 Tax=Physcomitrium patens TaxID=3218 RepID=A0A2K1IAJ6_PHYPA|nr:hypothetical protein PHYPA_030875 [Physcomitrium patens]
MSVASGCTVVPATLEEAASLQRHTRPWIVSHFNFKFSTLYAVSQNYVILLRARGYKQ